VVGSQPADDYTFFCGINRHLGTGLYIHKGIISLIKRVEFISDRMSYVTLRDHCYDVANAHAPNELKGKLL
jgi:hypothetical protein